MHCFDSVEAENSGYFLAFFPEDGGQQLFLEFNAEGLVGILPDEQAQLSAKPITPPGRGP